MPGLPTPPSRVLLHNRNIQIACYEREDGLFDVEAHLIDTKPFDLVVQGGRRKVSGTPIHDMTIRLTIDESATIVAVESVMDVPAHETCMGALPNYKALEGLRIGPGWVREAQKRVQRTAGCTHMTEMFTEIGTTAMQGLFGRANRKEQLGESVPRKFSGRSLVDTCFGWRADGYFVQLHKQNEGN